MSGMQHRSNGRFGSSRSENLNWRALEQFSFGDSSQLADELAEPRPRGKKAGHMLGRQRWTDHEVWGSAW
jgi:hypothetical protein